MDQNSRGREYSSNEVEIDLLEIMSLLIHWAWLIALVAVIAGTIAFCYSKFILPEQFQSSTKIYILNRNENQSDMPTSQDMQVSSQLTKDYAQLITSRFVLEQVLEELNLPMSYEALKNAISVTTPSDSRIIQITVTNTDPKQAQIIARSVRDTATEHIQKVMSIDAVNLVDDANLPNHKSAPNNTKNTLIGVLIGVVVVCAVLIVRHLMDDTIKSSEDVERYLNMSCLAMIPLDDKVSTETTGKKKRVRRHRSFGLFKHRKKKDKQS